jgi:hypothetical protein
MHFKILTLLFFLLFTKMTGFSQERGDIISYELVQSWDNVEVVQESFKLIESYTSLIGGDSATQEAFGNLLRAYITRNIQARSLKFYRLKYNTIDFDDKPAIASGLVIVPQRPTSTCQYGMAVYGHGTIFDRFSVPSYYFENGKYRGGELFFSIVMAAMEHFTIVPDYYGMGDGTGFHHHNMDKTNSSSTIDMMRAGRKLAAALNIELTQRVVITGYSEGGTVTMNTAKRIYEEGLTKEFPQLYLGPASGAYDLSEEAFNYIVDNPLYPTRQYILYIAAGCQDIFKNLYDPNNPNGIQDYLFSPYDELFKSEIVGQTGNEGWVPLPWPQMFKEGVIEQVRSNPNHPLRTCLKASDSYDWPNPYPTLMYYCNTDQQVPPSGAVKTHNIQQSYIPAWKFWDRFKHQINEVSFNRVIPDHETCALPSMLFFFENMRATNRAICKPARISQNGFPLDAPGEQSYFALKGSFEKAPVQIMDLNQKVYTIQPNEEEELNVFALDPGMYLYRSSMKSGKTDWQYFLKAPLSFVNTNDYNPVQTDEKGQYFVDISLLEAPVRRLEVYDENGNKVRVIANTEQNTSQISLTGKYNNGVYTIMVITDEQAFPLKWNVKAITEIKSKNFIAYVEENIAHIRSSTENGINTIEVFDIQGKQLIKKAENNLSQTTFSMKAYPSGMYIVLINGDNTLKLVRP